MLGMGGQPAIIRPDQSANGGNMDNAVNDADAYFAGIGSQQMAAMGIHGDAFGDNNGTEAGYVVNQYNPQQVYQPAQGVGSNGDLLIL